MISFEIARRHRYKPHEWQLPEDVSVHVLPTGDTLAFNDRRQFRYRDFSAVPTRIDAAYTASLDYLRDRGWPDEPSAQPLRRVLQATAATGALHPHPGAASRPDGGGRDHSPLWMPGRLRAVRLLYFTALVGLTR